MGSQRQDWELAWDWLPQPAAPLVANAIGCCLKEVKVHVQVDENKLMSELHAESVSSCNFMFPRVGCT